MSATMNLEVAKIFLEPEFSINSNSII